MEASLSFTVTDDDTAAALGSGSLAVLGTPRLLAWCEAATCAALAPREQAWGAQHVEGAGPQGRGRVVARHGEAQRRVHRQAPARVWSRRKAISATPGTGSQSSVGSRRKPSRA